MDVSKIQDKETLEFIDILKSATEGLKNTLNRYVDILQLKENLSVSVDELDFQETLDCVIEAVKTLLTSSKTKIIVDFSEAQRVGFNRNYLESIFLNLITNSIKYAKPGCPPTISIQTKKVDNQIKLVFSDEGIGFDMDKVKGKIFGLYQKFQNQIDSKGIGLYLVHTHVTALGGNISVESKPNEGATFTIIFKE
jgi:signal transduction histidine kinase